MPDFACASSTRSGDARAGAASAAHSTVPTRFPLDRVASSMKSRMIGGSGEDRSPWRRRTIRQPRSLSCRSQLLDFIFYDVPTLRAALGGRSKSQPECSIGTVIGGMTFSIPSS
jgi:hypothetical protein